ncbi:MAG: nicotinate-nucleotide adenylyltransferase [Actinomycetia bacterium]|nr:nicotinate-nucleotide adenylyltransferase [Actinomycetes bacterium]
MTENRDNRSGVLPLSGMLQAEVARPQTSAAAAIYFGLFAARIAASRPAQPFRLGLLGGTFDPVHHGHLLLAQAAYEQYALDGVLFLLASRPVHKLDLKVSDPSLRVRMLKLALAGDERFDISFTETAREGVTYTIDTLRQIQGIAADHARLFFIVGSDSLRDMPTWKNAKAIGQMVQVLYGRRPGSDAEISNNPLLEQYFDVAPVEMPQILISSSGLRQRAADGLTLRYLVPAVVADFVAAHVPYSKDA